MSELKQQPFGPVADCLLGDAVSENVGANQKKRLPNGAGKLSRVEHFRRLAENRKKPGHCVRCGKPHAGKTRQCERCRDYQRAYKLRRKAVVADVGLVVRVARLERQCAILARTIQHQQARYKSAYQRGYYRGLAGRRARFARELTRYEPPTITASEAAEWSHAYHNENE